MSRPGKGERVKPSRPRPSACLGAGDLRYASVRIMLRPLLPRREKICISPDEA